MSSLSTDALSLRPVSGTDLPFLHALYAETRAVEMAQTGWAAEMQTVFLHGQFEAQDRSYRQQFAGASFDVILAAGKPVGRLYVARLPGEVRVVEITLAAASREQGWGTMLLQRIFAEADRLGLPVRLSVDGNNRARRLYHRLGFVDAGGAGFYLHLERPASGKGA